MECWWEVDEFTHQWVCRGCKCWISSEEMVPGFQRASRQVRLLVDNFNINTMMTFTPEPNIIVGLGVQKSGTTSVYDSLVNIPQLFEHPLSKECHYFEHKADYLSNYTHTCLINTRLIFVFCRSSAVR